MSRTNLDSPESRAALNQGRSLARKKRVIREAWVRLAATVFAKSPKRYMELVREARELLHKEYKHDYNEAHPKVKRERLRRAP